MKLSFRPRLIYLANTLWWISFDPSGVCCSLTLWSAICTDFQILQTNCQNHRCQVRRHTEMSSLPLDVCALRLFLNVYLLMNCLWSQDYLLTSSMMMVLIYAPSPPQAHVDIHSQISACRCCFTSQLTSLQCLLVSPQDSHPIYFYIFKVDNLELIIPQWNGQIVHRRRRFLSPV